MKTKPHVTDQEMEGYMDFNAVLSAYRQQQPGGGKVSLTRKILWITGSTLVITSLLVWYAATRNQPSAPPTTPDAPIEYPLPEASPEALPADSVSVSTGNQPPKSSPNTETVKIEKRIAPVKESEKKSDASVTDEVTTYTPAAPVNGYDALYQYLNAQLAYPNEGIKDSIQGVTTVSFIINREGKAERIRIEQSLGTAFDREAIRVIEQMPRWTPALMNGEPVPSKLSLPLTFQLKRF